MMVETVTLPKVDPSTADRPGWWLWEATAPARVYVRCPAGHTSHLMFDKDHHSVDDNNGRLLPSLVCPMTDCTWHVFATLAGWEPLAK